MPVNDHTYLCQNSKNQKFGMIINSPFTQDPVILNFTLFGTKELKIAAMMKFPKFNTKLYYIASF